MGLLRGRTHGCFSQCYQEVPLSTWDLWPLKEIAVAFFCRNCLGSLLFSLKESLWCDGPFAQEPSGQKSRRREMNISLFSVEKVVFGRFVCSPEPAQGTRAVPVDGSVLASQASPQSYGGMQSTFTCPALLWRECRVLWTRVRAVRELKSISAGLVWVTGTQSPGSSPVQLGLSAPS